MPALLWEERLGALTSALTLLFTFAGAPLPGLPPSLVG